MLNRGRVLSGSSVLCAVGVLLCAGPSWAGKPGGGGTPPAGTVYYASAGTWAMAADGSAKVQLASGFLLPGNALHGSRRWFLETQEVGGTNPDGTPHVEAFAVALDGSPSVQLTAEPSLMIGWTRWGKDDSFFSFSGVDGSVAGAPVSCLARVALAWDGAGVPAAAGSVTYVTTIAGAEVPIGNGQVSGFISSHDWSPTGDRVVWTDHSTGSWVLRITTVTGGATTTLTAGNVPVWSPDGSKIAFGSGEIWVVAPNGTGLTRILRNGTRFNVFRPEWSPTGSHITYMRDDWSVSPRELDIYRATSSGSSATNLTPEAGDVGAGPILGWR
jgi:hypothetical protein